MSFFSNFGQVWFTLPNKDKIQINNITKFVALSGVYADDPRFSLTYRIADGDRPELISNRLYGDMKYWWTILLLNNIQRYEDQWPRNDEQLDAYIEKKYPYNEPTDIHHYVSLDGTITDPMAIKIKYELASEGDAIVRAGLTSVTIYDYETEVNDAKRNIRLIDPDRISSLNQELKDAFENG